MSKLLLSLLIVAGGVCWLDQAVAVDIDKPLNLAFVADRQDSLIDVIDLNKGKVVFTIETEFRADQLVVSPYTPILLYTNTELKAAVFYDLSARQTAARIELPMKQRLSFIESRRPPARSAGAPARHR